MPIKIAITDDHLLVLQGLNDLLRSVPDVEVIGTYASGDALLESLKKNVPDVLLLDMHMPGLSGADLVGQLRSEYPEIRIVILTGEGNTALAQYMMQQGCMGFLSKNNTSQEMLVEAIASVYEGNVFVDPLVKEKLLHRMFKRQDDDEVPGTISAREKEVLQHIAKGYKSQEIADMLSVGIRTVETHRRRLMKKLKAKNIAGLLKVALDLKLIK